MRAFKRFDKRGFTLVELMIVVAIIGVLAALAIYGVRRYLASAKTSEAKNSIGGIANGAAASYERETNVSELVAEGGQATAANHQLCGNAGNAVPAAIASVKGVKYQPKTADGQDFFTGDAGNGWKCLRFTITSPVYYQYNYNKDAYPLTGLGAGAGFEASAQGDLNGDGVLSTFGRTGTINTATNELRLATQIYVNNEFE